MYANASVVQVNANGLAELSGYEGPDRLAKRARVAEPSRDDGTSEESDAAAFASDKHSDSADHSFRQQFREFMEFFSQIYAFCIPSSK